MEKHLTDIEKQQLLTILYVHKIYAPGLDRLALRIAESISTDSDRESALLTVSYYLATSGSLALADEVARRLLQGYAKAAALAAIGTELAKANADRAMNYLREAEEFLSETSDADEQTILLQRISEGHSQLKNWQVAQDIAMKISQPEDRVTTLCGISEALWREGEGEKANRILAKARAAATETDLSDRSAALGDVARVLALFGNVAEAINTWEEVITFADRGPEPSKTLLLACEKLVTMGNGQRAREVALLIKNDARRREALSLVDKT